MTHYVYDVELGGDIATWAGAVGTIIAVIAAALVFRFESRLTRRSLDQTEQEIRTTVEQWELQRFLAASDQASKVSGWPDVYKFGEKSEHLEASDEALVDQWKTVTARMRTGDPAAVQVYDTMQNAYGIEGPVSSSWAMLICENRSQLPVYDVVARIHQLNVDGWVELSVQEWPIWTPDRERMEARIRNNQGHAFCIHEQVGKDFIASTRVELNFTDAAGRRWKRDLQGQLTLIALVSP